METHTLLQPLLCLPKHLTNLERNCDVSDGIFIAVNITSPDNEGHENCIYNGFCNVKVVENYHVHYKNQEMGLDVQDNISVVIEEAPNTPQAPQVWADPGINPYVYNGHDGAEAQEYSVCTETRTGRVMFQQHDTYITKSVYNYMEAVRYGSFNEVEDTNLGRRESYAPAQSMDFSVYEEDEYECGVFMSRMPETIMNQSQNRDLEEQKYANVQSENGALNQLMSSDIQSGSKQRKTILYLGPEPQNGQTIQQIAYHDPAVECPSLAGEVGNEVVIRK